MMIDIHSHLVFDVDDGAPTIEKSLEMLEHADRVGIKHIIATPHFDGNTLTADKAEKNFLELLTRTENSPIKIHLGFEVFFEPSIVNIQKGKKDLTLNHTQYMLIEFPNGEIPPYSSDTLFHLQLNNIVPILAHPERNIFFVKNLPMLMEWINRGCLIQVDAASIVGAYGWAIKRFTRKLIKKGFVNFIASDAHCAKDYELWFLPAYEKVKKWVGKEQALQLFGKNQEALIKTHVLNES